MQVILYDKSTSHNFDIPLHTLMEKYHSMPETARPNVLALQPAAGNCDCGCNTGESGKNVKTAAANSLKLFNDFYISPEWQKVLFILSFIAVVLSIINSLRK